MNPQIKFRDYLTSLRSHYGLATGIGLLIPAATYFTDTAPPLIPESIGLATGIGAAGLVVVFYYHPQSRSRTGERRAKRSIRLATRLIVSSFFLMVFYTGMLHFCTVREGSERFQIGFYTAAWSLTPEGMRVKVAHPTDTPWDWMMNDALFTEMGPATIWAQWSRYATFSIMITVLSAAFGSWSVAWGLLAREDAERRSRSQQRVRSR